MKFQAVYKCNISIISLKRVMCEEAYNRHGFSIELNSELPQGCVDDGGLVSHDFDEKFRGN